MGNKQQLQSSSDREYSVYKITNNINGKVYIGQTYHVKQRFYQHTHSSQNKHLHSAFEKYGIDNFTFEVLFTGLTKEESDIEEIRLIAEYDSANSSKGYNHRLGGSRGKNSPETKAKMSEAFKGRKMSAEAREKMSKARKGVKHSPEHTKHLNEGLKRYYETHDHPSKGKKWSEERKAHYKECIKRGKESHRWNNGKPVAQIDPKTGNVVVVYACAMDAYRKTGISNSRIGDVCNGKNPVRHTAGGFIWKYVNDLERSDNHVEQVNVAS